MLKGINITGFFTVLHDCLIKVLYSYKSVFTRHFIKVS